MQQAATRCRRTKLCPVTDCGAHVIHLPRHLRQKHGWTAAEARTAVQLYRLRSRSSRSAHRLKPPKYKDYHKPRQCPVDNCGVLVKRLDSHLIQSHKMARGSHGYVQMIAKSATQTKRCKTAIVSPCEDDLTRGEHHSDAEKHRRPPAECNGVGLALQTGPG